jgi:MFS superfamily sulfate permease-like transporter
VNTSKEMFSPGICRGESRAWFVVDMSSCVTIAHDLLIVSVFVISVPLIAGILTACATACAFFAEHVLELTRGESICFHL